MDSTKALMQTGLPLPNKREGKVRDVYDCTLKDGTEALLLVATDRLSAFDVVMPNGPAGKGKLLTQMSAWWFEQIKEKLGYKLQTHVLSTDPADIVGLSDEQADQLKGYVMIGRKTKVVPIECVVRGYLAGSGWKEYQQNSQVCGVALPGGLTQCAKLPEPIFTPATKAEQGEHDENISFERACGLVGTPTMEVLRDMSLRIYQMAHDYSAERGIILADTKFEFGVPLDAKDESPILIDEVLTPDSSRYWSADAYAAGRDQDSYDKQYVRNYLEALVTAGRWDKQAPGPVLPEDVLKNTIKKYEEAFEMITGVALH
ncbi:MAG: phosphoribosylaminoimidazolesuccinocarboxamide synthase [Phycisphaeraceae bacterium]|nr:phosphoribosylaminoimidazolesuccinocarboxamide synthase [Phycisphaeraceae bacterium]